MVPLIVSCSVNRSTESVFTGVEDVVVNPSIPTAITIVNAKMDKITLFNKFLKNTDFIRFADCKYCKVIGC